MIHQLLKVKSVSAGSVSSLSISLVNHSEKIMKTSKPGSYFLTKCNFLKLITYSEEAISFFYHLKHI